MVYVIKREEDDNISILPFLPIPLKEEEEGEDGQKLLYKFAWDYNSILPCLRWFVVDQGEEKSSVYLPAVLDYLETIKSLPAPPQEELRRIYGVSKKIEEFTAAIEDLCGIDLISRPPGTHTLSTSLIYTIDLMSQFYRVYPESVCDIVLKWLELDIKTRDAVKEIYKTKNIERQEEIIHAFSIPPMFLPLSLRFVPAGIETKGPEYKRKDLIAGEIIGEKEKAICKFKEKYGLGSVFSSTDLNEYGLNVPDITPYFELSRDWRNKTYKITKIL